MGEPDILLAVRPVIAALERLGIAYQIGGSVASSAYGFARATLDVDLVADVRAEHARSLATALEDEYYVDEASIERAVRTESSFNLIHLDSAIKVDVFVLKRGAYPAQAIERRRLENLGDADGAEPFYLSSPEDLALAKLDWYRLTDETSERQWTDVQGILKVQADRLDLAYLRHWAGILGLALLLDRALKDAAD